MVSVVTISLTLVFNQATWLFHLGHVAKGQQNKWVLSQATNSSLFGESIVFFWPTHPNPPNKVSHLFYFIECIPPLLPSGYFVATMGQRHPLVFELMINHVDNGLRTLPVSPFWNHIHLADNQWWGPFKLSDKRFKRAAKRSVENIESAR